MMASRFTKAFQLIALVLAIAVLQVYVMAGPIRTGNDPGTSASSAAQPTAEAKVATTTSENRVPAAEIAAEKVSLRFGSKSALNRLFSKSDVEARIASGNTFLKANTSAAATFKSTATRTAALQGGSTSDSDDNGSRGTWIAVGVIAAVLVIAVIGLRHDRSNPGVQ
jgi:uncharacterized membrane protein